MSTPHTITRATRWVCALAVAMVMGVALGLASTVAAHAAGGRWSYNPATGVLTFPAAPVKDGKPVRREAAVHDHVGGPGNDRPGRNGALGWIALPAKAGSIRIGVITVCGRGQWDARVTATRKHIAGRVFTTPTGPCEPTPTPTPTATPTPRPTPTTATPTRRATPAPARTTTRPVAAAPTRTPARPELANTGPADWRLAVLAFALLAGGGTLLRVARRQP